VKQNKDGLAEGDSYILIVIQNIYF